MSGKPRGVRKVLPAIPVGVQPASPLMTARNHASFTHSPLLPRSVDPPISMSKDSSRLHPDSLTFHKASSKDGEDSSVCVAVRVRPFNKREKLLGANQVVSMTSSRTSIISSEGKLHMFDFDHCFWSVIDEGGEGSNNCYSGQEEVYKKLAQPLLDNSFKGYNTCLFAYGQTGSGKSYCIMGEGENVGIVPRFTKELFDRVEGTSDSKNTYNLQVSYYEIYNEKVYDLLRSNAKHIHKCRTKLKLRVREHQVFGPYVEDLSTYVATSYNDIERWLRIGNRCRATNATSMNDRSSRSHAVFTIHLTHTTVEEEEEHSTVSRINIIDLAGSERSKVANTSGDRLKEGASINRSLHTLGKVISLLSDQSTGRREKVYIPYRDSTLTWLLKDSLGGNSKTAMIATISPADLHYQESIGTLRYAQTARSIVNVARINEDPNIKMIRELTSEIHHLRDLLTMQGGEAELVEIKNLREQLLESEKLMSEATRSWKEKLKETEERKKEEIEQLKQAGAITVNSRLPNLVNLTEDPQLSEVLLFLLKPGLTRVGNGGGDGRSHDIELTGALVVKDHCVFVHEQNSVRLEPSSDPDAQTFVNGQLLHTPLSLHHGDRVVLGGDYFFRFSFPIEVENGVTVKKGQQGFEYARNELVKAQTERLERESEEKILKERENMLSELERIRQSAQLEMDQQQLEYQDKLQELSKEMEVQHHHLRRQKESSEAAEVRMEDLLKHNQELEEETVAQRHIIHLEKIRTEKESRELEDQKNQLMLDLEQEKYRLEEDIQKLHKNKSLRSMQSEMLLPTSSDSLLTDSSNSSLSETSILRHGSELVRVSMMLQEAAAICKTLNKPLSFTRDEVTQGYLCIRVSNHQTNVVSYWDMNKFEMRVEQMREIYQMRGSSSDIESNSTSLITGNDPFSDPSDEWASSPFRSLPRRHSMFSAPSTPKPIQFDLNSKSPNMSPPKPDLWGDSTWPGVLEQLNMMLNYERDYVVDKGSIDVMERMMECICTLKRDCMDMSQKHLEVEGKVISMYSSLKTLTEGNCPLSDNLSGDIVSLRLIKTLCNQTALYFIKLLKGSEDSLDCNEDLQTSVDTACQLMGELWLAREVQVRLLQKQFHSFNKPVQDHHVPPDIKSFVIEGVSGGCVGAINYILHAIEESVISLSQGERGQMIGHVHNLIGSVLTFLKRLTEIMPVIWSTDTEPLPFLPAVEMIIVLPNLKLSLTALPRVLLQDNAPPSSCQECVTLAAAVCKELAVSVLSFLKSVDSGKMFSVEVQSLSHQMAHAGKTLHLFIKKGQLLHE